MLLQLLKVTVVLLCLRQFLSHHDHRLSKSRHSSHLHGHLHVIRHRGSHGHLSMNRHGGVPSSLTVHGLPIDRVSRILILFVHFSLQFLLILTIEGSVTLSMHFSKLF